MVSDSKYRIFKNNLHSSDDMTATFIRTISPIPTDMSSSLKYGVPFTEISKIDLIESSKTGLQ